VPPLGCPPFPVAAVLLLPHDAKDPLVKAAKSKKASFVAGLVMVSPTGISRGVAKGPPPLPPIGLAELRLSRLLVVA
jgi:hypothetical protein